MCVLLPGWDVLSAPGAISSPWCFFSCCTFLSCALLRGVGHGNLFRLSKPASFAKDRNPKVGQTHFRARTRLLRCRDAMSVAQRLAGHSSDIHDRKARCLDFGFRFSSLKALNRNSVKGFSAWLRTKGTQISKIG